jgi:hypothetical protein
MSHVIGLRVAGMALRDTSGATFDESVTCHLHEELIDLGACTRPQTARRGRLRRWPVVHARRAAEASARHRLIGRHRLPLARARSALRARSET